MGRGTVVAGFSSGELNGYRYETAVGLAGPATKNQYSDERFFALGHRRRSGHRQWTGVRGRRGRKNGRPRSHFRPAQWEFKLRAFRRPGSLVTWVFVVTDDDKLLCIYRQNELHPLDQSAFPRSSIQRRRRATSTIRGRARGRRLLLTASNGEIIQIDPATGSYQSQFSVGSPVSFPPVVAGVDALYLRRPSAPARLSVGPCDPG